MEELPAFIRNSTVLSLEEKKLLASVTQVPTDAEVDEIRYLPEILELTNAFIGDESSRGTHLQLKAKAYIEKGDLTMAWRVLFI